MGITREEKRINKLIDRKSAFTRLFGLLKTQKNAKELIQSEPNVIKSRHLDSAGGGGNSGFINAYNNFVNGTYLYELSPKARIAEYDTMARDPEINYALTEIADEICMEDNEGKMFEIGFSNRVKPEQREVIEDEFKSLIIDNLRLNRIEDIWEWVFQWISRGVVVFKIEYNRTENTGIEKIVELNPWLVSVQKDEEDGKEYYIVKDQEEEEVGHKYDKTEIICVDSGYLYDGQVFSILEFVKKDWRRLNLMEDATVIYKLSRSPLRRIFKVFVGKMAPSEIESYLQSFKLRLKEDISYDANKGEVVGLNPITILDDFFFPVLEGGQESCSVDTLEEKNTGWDNQEEIRYFLGKVYRGLKIPVGRMNIPDSNGEHSIVSSGSRMGEISRDEMKFSKFVTRLRNRFMKNFIQELFFRHLLFRKLIDELRVKSQDIEINFSYKNPFSELKDQELIETRINNFNSLNGVAEGISWRFLAEKYLHFSNEDFDRNDELFMKEAKLMGLDVSRMEKGLGGGAGISSGGLGEDMGEDLEGGLGEDMGEEITSEAGLEATPSMQTMGLESEGIG